MHQHRSNLLESFLKRVPQNTNEFHSIPLPPYPSPSQLYGQDVFNLEAIRSCVSEKTYSQFILCFNKKTFLETALAEQIATALKIWAIHHGCTHYTHWFLPLHSSAAEKHDSFLELCQDGNLIDNLSANSLLKSEPDASSFPSGGLRSTFEARGYAVWDILSFPFIRHFTNGKTLYIPSSFHSFNGEALDHRTPLIRSEKSLEINVQRLLNILGLSSAPINVKIGAEQEFFLIDNSFSYSRLDLILTGRTLFGSSDPKGQSLSNHYFGKIPNRVLAFLQEVENIAWRCGIPCKTRHNEVAPSQYEIASLYENCNISLDHNMLLMDILRETSVKHNLTLLLHEKPFQHLNGSGKHVNYSIWHGDNNLFDVNYHPLAFITLIILLIRSVHLYSQLLRSSIAIPGNDYRLGGHEAPPSIVSIYLGEHISSNIMKGSIQHFLSGTSESYFSLPLHSNNPEIDRNRTSPLCFTGNKFEFRMVGSSQSISQPIVVLNTIISESCVYILERISQSLLTRQDRIEIIILDILRDILKDHYSIVYNGNSYSQEWLDLSQKRGLNNIPLGIDSLECYNDPTIISLFDHLSILSPNEIKCHYSVCREKFIDHIEIEKKTLIEMVKTQIIPSALRYQSCLSNCIKSSQEVLTSNFDHLNQPLSLFVPQVQLLFDLTTLQTLIWMKEMRSYIDELEGLVDNEYWGLPKYSEMLHYMDY